jgi:hypothetical protein
VSGERLYLKTDQESRAKFEAKGLAPFEYMRSGKLTPTSYVEAPPEIYEDREEAARWARLAWEAVLRAKAARPRDRTRLPGRWLRRRRLRRSRPRRRRQWRRSLRRSAPAQTADPLCLLLRSFGQN